jgi:acetyltransferase-like isoleucine patch superfamily enzyme
MDCCFLFGTLFTNSGAEVGKRVYVGAHCIIGLATIGDDTMLADHVYVLSGKHQHQTSEPGVAFQNQPQRFSRVTIGRNCWLGTNTVVMADIGDNCVIGAGSVVTKSIPDNCVAVGNPARVIRATLPQESTAGQRPDHS